MPILRILVLLCSVLLVACQAPEPPIRIGTNVWIGYEPLYLARSFGWLTNKETRLLEFTSASQVMSALEHGSIDAAALTLDEAMLVLHRGVDIKIVLVMDASAGGDALLARPEITSLTQLKGKTIGLEDTALGAYMLHRILGLADLSVNDIHTLPVEVNQHEAAYLNRTVDAVVSFDPVKSRLQAQGATVLMDSSQLPNEIIDVLVVRTDMEKTLRMNLRRLLASWFLTLDFLKQNPEMAVGYMVPRFKMEGAGIRKMLDGVSFPSRQQNSEWLLHDTSTLMNQIERMHEVMQKNQLISSDISVTPFLDNSLLTSLYQ